MNGEWRDHAACAGHPDPELWFTTNHDYSDRAQHDHHPRCRHCLALAVCAWCPVRIECLTDQLRHEMPGKRGDIGSVQRRHGIWGGTTPPQRRRLADHARTQKAGAA